MSLFRKLVELPKMMMQLQRIKANRVLAAKQLEDVQKGAEKERKEWEMRKLDLLKQMENTGKQAMEIDDQVDKLVETMSQKHLDQHEAKKN